MCIITRERSLRSRPERPVASPLKSRHPETVFDPKVPPSPFYSRPLTYLSPPPPPHPRLHMSTAHEKRVMTMILRGGCDYREPDLGAVVVATVEEAVGSRGEAGGATGEGVFKSFTAMKRR